MAPSASSATAGATARGGPGHVRGAQVAPRQADAARTRIPAGHAHERWVGQAIAGATPVMSMPGGDASPVTGSGVAPAIAVWCRCGRWSVGCVRGSGRFLSEQPVDPAGPADPPPCFALRRDPRGPCETPASWMRFAQAPPAFIIGGFNEPMLDIGRMTMRRWSGTQTPSGPSQHSAARCRSPSAASPLSTEFDLCRWRTL